MAAPGSFPLKHYSGTASTVMVPVKLTRIGHGVDFANLDATNNLNVSFDGKNTHPVFPKTHLVLDGTFLFFHVQASAATVAWTAVVSEG